MQAQLTYMNRRGAGVLICDEASVLVAKLPTLRREATIRTLDGIEAGWVWRFTDLDDRRAKWNWCYDVELLGLGP